MDGNSQAIVVIFNSHGSVPPQRDEEPERGPGRASQVPLGHRWMLTAPSVKIRRWKWAGSRDPGLAAVGQFVDPLSPLASIERRSGGLQRKRGNKRPKNITVRRRSISRTCRGGRTTQYTGRYTVQNTQPAAPRAEVLCLSSPRRPLARLLHPESPREGERRKPSRTGLLQPPRAHASSGVLVKLGHHRRQASPEILGPRDRTPSGRQCAVLTGQLGLRPCRFGSAQAAVNRVLKRDVNFETPSGGQGAVLRTNINVHWKRIWTRAHNQDSRGAPSDNSTVSGVG